MWVFLRKHHKGEYLKLNVFNIYTAEIIGLTKPSRAKQKLEWGNQALGEDLETSQLSLKAKRKTLLILCECGMNSHWLSFKSEQTVLT